MLKGETDGITRACIKYHVDYVDLTGELLFVGRMLKKYVPLAFRVLVAL